MSVPLTGKVTSLTVKNTLNATEIWSDAVHIRNPETRQYHNILEFVDQKLADIRLMEAQMKTTIEVVNKTLKALRDMPRPEIKPQTVQIPVKGEKGDVGPQGPQGKPGKPGLRGPKGDSVSKLASIPDVDTSNLSDGAMLVWSAEKEKWVAQQVLEDE